MSDDPERSIISRPESQLSVSGRSSIVARMVEETLAIGRTEAIAQTPRFKIGKYEWREPDYRQILLWAEELKMEPITVIEKLDTGAGVFGKTAFQDGRMLSLCWDLDLLHLYNFKCVEGIVLESLEFYFGSEDDEENKAGTSGRVALSIPSLTKITCYGGQLAELNLAQTSNLTQLICDSNQLTELNLSHVPKLTGLSCGDNHLTELNLSLVPNLSKLNCYDNRLTELNLTCVPKLTGLSCHDNRLTELNLTCVPNLTELSCYDNQLTELNLTCVPNLTNLWCHHNQLTELDIRPVLSLKTLIYDSERMRLIKRPDQNF